MFGEFSIFDKCYHGRPSTGSVNYNLKKKQKIGLNLETCPYVIVLGEFKNRKK